MRFRALFTAVVLLLSMPIQGAQGGQITAQQILKETGIPAGLCVHVSSGDGALSLDLARAGKFLLHGLEKDRGYVEQSREKIAQAGLSGQVTIEHWNESYLPYANNLVNLLVAEDLGKVSQSEVMRVLRPFGVAYIHKGGAWTKTKKPWVKGMDEWSHPNHGADGNLASRDTVLTLPKRIQWLSGRLHKTFLSGGGNNYYGKGSARDGFNSLPLWSGAPRVLVATGERVYCHSGGLVALDSHSGKQIQTFPEAGSVSTLLHLPDQKGGGTLIVGGGGVRALDAKTGKKRWAYDGGGDPKHMVAGDDNVIFTNGSNVICLSLADGQEKWKKGHGFAGKAKGASYRNHMVAFHGNSVNVLDAKDGNLLWSKTVKGSMAWVGDYLWVREGGKYPRKVPGYDPRAGDTPKKTLTLGYGHCHGLMATDRYFIDGELDFTDVSSGKRDTNQITKAGCGKSFLPANGLLYTFSTGCICFPMMKDFMALAPDPSGAAPPAGNPTFKGSASASKAPQPKGKAGDEWPMYRHDVWRSSCTSSGVPSTFKQLWSSPAGASAHSIFSSEWKSNPLDASITAPTIAEGLVFVGTMNTHQVVALDAQNGKERWRFIANGRIDTPPSIYQGLCLFGTRSGWVYGLTAATGELVWRFRAGPHDRRIVAYGQLESAWPVPGTVLIDNGTAYVGAGRHALADGGIHLYALDPKSGTKRWEQKIDSIPMPRNRWYGRLGNDFDVFDILAKDGGQLSLSRWNIDPVSGKVTGNRRKAFFSARKTGMAVLRGIWSYSSDKPNNRGRRKRPLAVYNDDTIFIGGKSLFASKMIKASEAEGMDGKYMEPKNSPREYKIAWTPYKTLETLPQTWTAGGGKASGMLIAGETLFVAGSGLNAYSVADGKQIGHVDLNGAPVWDGMASAYGRIYLSTTSGSVVCYGDPSGTVPQAASSDRIASRTRPKAPRTRSGSGANQSSGKQGRSKIGNKPASSAAPTTGWDSKLLAALKKDLKAGRKPVFMLSAMRQRFMVSSIEENGKMNLTSKVISLPYQWERLTLKDKASLASSMAADGNQEKCLLAGYYLQATGRKGADDFFMKVKDKDAVMAARASAKQPNASGSKL